MSYDREERAGHDRRSRATRRQSNESARDGGREVPGLGSLDARELEMLERIKASVGVEPIQRMTEAGLSVAEMSHPGTLERFVDTGDGVAGRTSVQRTKAGADSSYGGPARRTRKQTKERARHKPYAKHRPSYLKHQPKQVWENAKQPDGNVYDPNTGEKLEWDRSKDRDGQWDMGHKPGEEYWRKHEAYMKGQITKEQFLQWYHNPNNYQPESPSANRSHKYEDKS
ncbi:HNH/ENDO VII family nuclease [Natronobiforma cellulositropha]|uniref:HNH/ENDO VII family nuclease n=1 Tax=Natronobiforma cellulositropha TaxID=1679076 RepID=UPI0021D601D2|nr:HNH/ENDO VII family nuclease [Natronobiforma cellulositropha]